MVYTIADCFRDSRRCIRRSPRLTRLCFPIKMRRQCCHFPPMIRLPPTGFLRWNSTKAISPQLDGLTVSSSATRLVHAEQIRAVGGSVAAGSIFARDSRKSRTTRSTICATWPWCAAVMMKKASRIIEGSWFGEFRGWQFGCFGDATDSPGTTSSCHLR